MDSKDEEYLKYLKQEEELLRKLLSHVDDQLANLDREHAVIERSIREYFEYIYFFY